VRPGHRLTVTSEAVDELGRGVARGGPGAVVVGDLLPGESAEVVIDHVSRQRATAFATVAARVGAPSADRRPPACPGFGRCGGCGLQALAYPAQLEVKRARVASALAAAGLDATVPPVIGAPTELGYRNRATYVVAGGAGHVRLGAYEPGSHRHVETLGCRAVRPTIDELAAAAAAALSASGLEVHRERERRGQLRYVVIRAGAADRALVALVTTPDTPRAPLAVAADRLASDPRVAGVIWVRNGATSGAILSDDHELLAGEAVVTEVVAGIEVALEIGSFTQVNLPAAEQLYRGLVGRLLATDLGSGDGGAPPRVIDLYSGTGAIAFALAAAGARALGVERNSRAVEAARRAADRAGLADRVRFVVGEAADLATSLAAEPADAIVVNPPRKGLDEATRQALLERRPRAIGYVSCEPSTLARDLVALAAGGYRIAWLQPYDLMPGAGPIETAVVVERA
jgi:23S rRNA (uracil1939-C5)-methyltransferase